MLHVRTIGYTLDGSIKLCISDDQELLKRIANTGKLPESNHQTIPKMQTSTHAKVCRQLSKKLGYII